MIKVVGRARREIGLALLLLGQRPLCGRTLLGLGALAGQPPFLLGQGRRVVLGLASATMGPAPSTFLVQLGGLRQ
ncbi:hypothetical protein [Nonomuraea cavernae]|uniref:hypothetical protein n=1 Tax=Nonomuraea cavernae TaxID=2045107 RepID=UPI0016637A9E|nr:hypothetical protein [Nonomuraea cavernae]MCA2191022.1 hypothetical protein [Nonomuraea cavernae]